MEFTMRGQSLRSMVRRFVGHTAAFEHITSRFLHSRRSYAQFGEDLYLLSYYDRLMHDFNFRVEKGLFVDIGAFRPISLSNSYHFYKMGWQCINIDPTPGTKKLFDKVRPRDVNLELAINGSGNNEVFYCFDTPSVWNTLDADAASYATRLTGIKPTKSLVKTARLDTVLRDVDSKFPFEVLSIDAEGFDIEILETLDFNVFKPRIILVEANEFNPMQAGENKIVRHLMPLGYRLHSWIMPNLLFSRTDSVFSL